MGNTRPKKNKFNKWWLIIAPQSMLTAFLVGLVGFTFYTHLQRYQIELDSEHIYSYMYPFQNARLDTFELVLDGDDYDVRLLSWSWSLRGQVRLIVVDENNEAIYISVLKPSIQLHRLYLPPGQYRVLSDFSNAYFGGHVVGLTFLPSNLWKLTGSQTNSSSVVY
jgi:hypothetical protein